MDFLNDLDLARFPLTEAQCQAVTHKDGPLLVIAGPGAGKTRVITARVAALLALGVHPAHIMVVTFTRAAAQEMRSRVEKMPGVRPDALGSLRIGTFHSLFWNMLNAYGYRYKMVDTTAQRKWVEKALRHLGEAVNDDVVDSMLAGIGYAKNNMQTVQQISKDDKLLADVWLLYEQYKDDEGLADFDDLLVRTHDLLCENPKALLEQQQRTKYLLVDEFQDTSKVQYSILRLLAAPLDNFCVVGDVDQAIYGWRAARPEYLLDFKRNYPLVKTVMLSKNFRSVPPLVSYANRIIVNNKARYPLVIEAVRSGGEAPTSFQPETETAEARVVLKMVGKFKGQGLPLEQMAVFYRVNRYGRHLVNALIEQQVPFTLWDKGKTFDQHWVIREVLAFLRLSVERNHLPSFQALARRQLKLEDETIVKVTQSVQQGEPLWAVLNRVTVRLKVDELTSHLNKARDLTPGQALDYYLSDLGLKSYLTWYAGKRATSPTEFLSLCDDMRSEMSGYEQVSGYLKFVEKRSFLLQQAKTETPRSGHINLMTLHAAKGLEFSHVWLVGVTDGLIPHSRSEGPEQYEEERRLFYVGCTRAKDNLFILSPRSLEGKITQHSPFLDEGLGTALRSQHNVLPRPKIGMTVVHKTFGSGNVTDIKIEGIKHFVEVQFGKGRRKLDWELCLQQGFFKIS